MTGKKESTILPNHVAIIPDGNRRWAKSHRLSLLQAYDLGIKKFITLSEWLSRMGVRTLSAWALSTDNIRNRSKAELDLLYSLYIKAVEDKKVAEILRRNRTHVNIIGDLSLIPEKVRKELHKLETLTKNYHDNTMNLLVAYGGKEDLLYAVKRIAKKSAMLGRSLNITSEELQRNLITSKIPEVDLMIRTSGEKRTSGMLPWQGAYAELYFAKKYWPEFGERDLKNALDWFSRRKRRFGK
ncbi:MAG: polyprenyl diphosphate synthase [Candidatus Micrarchaeia archaeon]